nr:DNA/RNA non-specific endonuclease [uncultured Albidiferax sp.]
MPKKKPRKPSKSALAPSSRVQETLRRSGVRLFTAAVLAIQAASCVSPPDLGHPSITVGASGLDAVVTSTRFAACPQFFAGSVAPSIVTDPKAQLRALCYENFAVLHDGANKTPLYVAERLNRQILLAADGQTRLSRFHSERLLPTNERAEPSDYLDSGYAQGHMAPAADMPTPNAMRQSFTLSNAVPQNPGHNSGAWLKIEKDTRAYVMRAAGDVYVITAPVYEPGGRTIGSNQVRVPTHLFKLVYDPNTQRAWVHWQQNGAGTRAGQPLSYGELEYRTHREWLPGVGVR